MTLAQKLGKPELTPVGTCYTCGKVMHKSTAVFCNVKCRNKYYKVPTLPTLEKYVRDGIAKATDGCKVEPDGTCQHGKQSWLLVLGLI